MYMIRRWYVEKDLELRYRMQVNMKPLIYRCCSPLLISHLSRRRKDSMVKSQPCDFSNARRFNWQARKKQGESLSQRLGCGSPAFEMPYRLPDSRNLTDITNISRRSSLDSKCAKVQSYMYFCGRVHCISHTATDHASPWVRQAATLLEGNWLAQVHSAQLEESWNTTSIALPLQVRRLC